jgi:long-subunit fatty acid transport protein
MAALQYIMSSKTTMDLRYNHETEFSTHGNYQLVDRIEFGVSHAFNRQLSGQLDLYYEHSDPSGENPHEPLNGIDLSESAPNVNREGAGIGFRYAINDWMDVDMSMSVENRNDVPENSFKNYQGLLGFTFYLNALTSRMRAPVDD